MWPVKFIRQGEEEDEEDEAVVAVVAMVVVEAVEAPGPEEEAEAVLDGFEEEEGTREVLVVARFADEEGGEDGLLPPAPADVAPG